MKKLTILLLLFLGTVPLLAQDVQNPLRIRDLSGVNTKDAILSLKPNEALCAHNIDLSRYGVGSMSQREGYQTIGLPIGNADSIIFLDAIKRNDGRRALFFVVKDSTKGYGSIWMTPWGSDRLDSARKVWDKWPTTNKPSFAVYRDQIIGVNGRGTGAVFDGATSTSYPLRVPGQPTVVPLQASGKLSGIYRYTILCARGGETSPGTVIYFSAAADYVLPPVKISNGKVLLTGFQFPITDSLRGSGLSAARYYVYRTLGTTYPLKNVDSFYYIGQYATGSTPNALSTVEITDTCSDGELKALALTTTYIPPVIALDHRVYGRITGRSDTLPFFTPGYVGKVRGSALMRGFSHNDSAITKGVIYNFSFSDSSSGYSGDTCRGLYIAVKPEDSGGFTIRIPKGDSTLIGKTINLWRGFATSASKDSVSSIRYKWHLTCYNINQQVSAEYDEVTATYNPPRWTCQYTDGWKFKGTTLAWTLQSDSVRVDEIRLVKSFRVADTFQTFVDSLTRDTLRTKPLYQKGEPPFLPELVVVDGTTIFIASGSQLWYMPDSLGGFTPLSSQQLGRNDGEPIVAGYAARTAMRWLKIRSNFNLYGDFSKPELVGYYGTVAPLSVVHSINATYFLADAGIVAENEVQTLERAFDRPLLSSKLNNFEVMSMDAKRTAIGLYDPQRRKAMWSVHFPAGVDTTYVWDEKALGWVTWSIPFGGGCIYDTGSISPNSLYFFLRGGKQLYKFGGSWGDGQNISTRTPRTKYISAPLLATENKMQITGTGIWFRDGDPLNVLDMYYKNDSGQVMGNDLIDTFTTSRYRTVEQLIPPARYYQWYFESRPNALLWLSGAIDGIDVYWRRGEGQIVR